MQLQVHPSTWQWTVHNTASHMEGPSTARPLTNGPSYWSVVWDWGWFLASPLSRLTPCQWDPTNGASIELLGIDCLRGLSCLRQPWHQVWLVLGDVFPDVSNPNTIVMSLAPLTWFSSKTNTYNLTKHASTHKVISRKHFWTSWTLTSRMLD